MQTLSSILHPYPVEKFLAENWTKQAVFIPSEQPGKFKHLFSWQQLNDLLNYHKIQYPHLRFVVRGDYLPECDPHEWVKRCREGATLAVDHLHDRIPALADLEWGLEREIGHSKTHINLYCSWPGYQGFECHYDTHEVFVFQIEGEKEWFVFGETQPYPRERWHPGCQKPPEEPPYLRCVLKPGDLLYIPRGHWHYAIAQDQPSLHLTMGVRCFVGSDLLNWMVDQIKDEEIWRKNLPLIPQGDTAQIQEYSQRLLDHLSATLRVKQQELSQGYVRFQSLKGSSRHPEISLPNQVGFNLFEQELDTRLRVAKHQKVLVEFLDEGKCQLVTGKKKLMFKGLDIDLIKKLVNKLFTTETFTAKDVAEWLPEADLEIVILPLLASLIKEGFIVAD
jgi:ribosomal protein L16 Arg81 hydroxylase